MGRSSELSQDGLCLPDDPSQERGLRKARIAIGWGFRQDLRLDHGTMSIARGFPSWSYARHVLSVYGCPTMM